MPSLDAEEAVIAWLNNGILPDGYIAYGDRNDAQDDDEKFVLVDRTGGPREAMVLDKAEIMIEVWNKNSRKEAKDVAMALSDRIPDLVFYSDDLTRAQLNSVVNIPNTISQYYRYQVYCDVWCRRAGPTGAA